VLAVRSADQVADLMREDAHSVERRAALEERISELDLLEDALHDQRLDVLESQRAAELTWQLLWKTICIEAPSTRDADEWIDGFRSAIQTAAEMRRVRAQIDATADAISRQRSDVVAALSATKIAFDSKASLVGLLDLADNAVAKAEELRQRRRALQEGLTDGESAVRRHRVKHARCEEARATWREQWAAAVKPIGLTATATAVDALAVLKTLSELRQAAAELDDLERRISGIERRNNQFADGVTALMAGLEGHSDLMASAPDVAVSTLTRRLEAAQEVATEQRTTAREVERHRDLVEDAETRVRDAEKRIEAVIASVALASEHDLREAVSRSGRHEMASSMIAEAEQAIREATGLMLEDVEAETDEFVGVQVDVEIDEISQELEVLDAKLAHNGELVGELQTKRCLIDGSAGAADAMGRAQGSLARVASSAEEYVDVVLARRLLEEQIAAFRDEHQGPMLARARTIFRDLTLGAFEGLDTDTDDKGIPYLLARTPKGRLLDVSALSTGTRDQLYLALRLAALEHVLDQRGPMPIVLDDLFVHFDDDRTAAGLRVLAELSSRTQVLLFSHHEAVARSAAEITGPDPVTIHRLGADVSSELPREIDRPMGTPTPELAPSSAVGGEDASRICRGCKQEFYSGGRRGRPPVLCPECRTESGRRSA
jgi:uncharacterized protein YhaN